MKIDKPREAAFRCVRSVDAEDGYANLAMPGILAALGLSGRDAAFATELAYGTLRMRGRYDAIIAVAARRYIATLDDPVRWSLWLGAHQALSMRVPPHAAVSETVDIARRHGGPRVAPLVNAVMRRIVERKAEAWMALVEALSADGRQTDLEALLIADNVPAAVTLVARPGLADRESLPGPVTELS